MEGLKESQLTKGATMAKELTNGSNDVKKTIAAAGAIVIIIGGIYGSAKICECVGTAMGKAIGYASGRVLAWGGWGK